MKNLYRIALQSARFDGIPSSPDRQNLMVVDSNNSNLVYIVVGSVLYRLDRTNPHCVQELVSLPGTVVGVEHLALNDEICLATEAGEVLVVNLGRIGEEPEVVTFCGGGMMAMGWSPDQEVVVFVDCNLNVVAMNSAYDPINEVSLKDDTFGDREFMSVGWGKKETQFHGSEGKSAARKKKEETEVEIDLSKIDPQVQISWRADGEYFAVGFLGPFGRAFKVFNKEGALQFTSEKCYGLEVPMGWKPSGLWIAVPQILKDKYVVALFEKNGLKHREIDLPFSHEDELVKGIYWSHDSEVLVIRTQKLSRGKNCLYFLIICNYHWYIKQYQEFEQDIIGIQWDLKYSERRTLHVLLKDGHYEASRWDFSVDHSTGLEHTDESLVAVIDRASVLLTNFRGVVIPPPMCGFSVKVEDLINSISFLRNPQDQMDSNCFLTVDFHNKVSFFKPDFTDTAVRRLTGVQLLGKALDIGPGNYSHWLWLSNDTLLAVEGSNTLKVFKVDVCKSEFCVLDSFSVGTEIDRIGCIEPINESSAMIETFTGQLFKLELQPSISLCEHLQLPEFCEQMRIDHSDPTKCKIYSLRNRQNLYADGIKIASDVTSMFLTEHYLLFTTISELKFVDLKKNVIVGDRRIERGSKLVVVVPKSARTVFQLPRGNLEAIAPRILSLCLVADHLNALEYHEAFDILRKERINLNLIVDHNPHLFLSNLDRFLEEITNVNWLNLFISDLQNQDVCSDMYESNYLGREVSAIDGYQVDSKSEFLCDRLLQAFNSAKTGINYMLPKITCYVKKGMLEKALEVIWDLKKMPSKGDDADEALKYLLYLVNVNDLFNVALGMYDFGLVLFVATKSQKDPKEYLPFLNELKRLDEDYRKYKIDCHLKRFGKAIENISRYQDDEGKFQEALQLTITHGLYGKAMIAYKGNDKYYRKICTSYGDHLRQANKQVEASLIYEKAGEYQLAIAAARNAADWERCLKLAAIAGYDHDEVRRLVQSLIPALQESGEYVAASRLVKDYLKDHRIAVEILLKDHLFDKALLEAHISDRSLVDDLIRPNLKGYLQTFLHKLASEKEEFTKHKNRLLLVREEKAKKKLDPQHDEDDDNLEDCDLYSEVSTVASSRHTTSSGRSGKSHRSSKNRRKHERKLLSLKEGNPYEDIALVDALHTLVTRLCSPERQRQVRTICKAAIEMDFLLEASHIQKEYGELFHLIKFSLDAIWIPEMVVPGSGQDVETTAMATGNLEQVQNVQHYAMIKPHQRYKPDLQSVPWKFEVLE
ncbi:putative elongator complex protein 1 isoform X1 [Aedes aegypti]|uniref:Elongator complex protein 1 n=2 Tax=Aedes aegypti TaxID=7159 RepID=A0A1S4EXL4_AEDAE|nr:putative elongator complex protein 1 isoform X1 [Aedes aegypti]